MKEQSSQKIVIVGAGVIGATAAYHLQAGGAAVTVIDAGGLNASKTSFGWVNASFFLDHHHFALRTQGIAAYHRLSKDVTIPISWCGSLNWEFEGDTFDAFANELDSLDYPSERLKADDIRKLEPALTAPPDRAIRFPTEAAIEADGMADALLAAATRNGARVIRGVTVDGILQSGGRATGVSTTVGPIAADQVLVAGGVGCEALLKTVGIRIPMLRRPALLLRTQPISQSLNHILVTGIGEIRQLPDGSILMPTAVNHQASDAETVGVPDVEADVALERLRAVLPGLYLEWSEVALAHRPVPGDNYPAVGAVGEGLYMATLHSGVTLAAIMGELIASEMMNGPSAETESWLEPYRPTRFAK